MINSVMVINDWGRLCLNLFLDSSAIPQRQHSKHNTRSNSWILRQMWGAESVRLLWLLW